jgi:amino acid transporter
MYLSIAAFIQGSAYIGGEVKHAGKTQLLSMPLAVIILMIGTLALFITGSNMVGSAFWNSINWLWWQGAPLALPLWPMFNLWPVLATNNGLIAAIVGIGFLALGIQYPPMNLMVCTRMVFSWSFDRIFPAKFASVSDRTHSPIWAIVLMALISEVFLVIFTYTTWMTGIAAIAAEIGVYFFVSLAATIFPFRKKEMYEASTIAKYKVGGLPLITVVGIGGMILDFLLVASYVSVSGYLANSTPSLMLIGGVIVLGFVIYFIANSYRKSKGIDLSLSFKELPPE